MSDKALIIFIKNPILGKVKTRLAKTVGEDEALEVYYKLLEVTRNAAKRVDATRHVYYSGFVDKNDQWSPILFKKHKQNQSPDLGTRMTLAFESEFKNGAQKVVIIGSDCPEISSDIIDRAFNFLESNDFVIGPTFDGGYYLLGMKAFSDEVFKNIEWSTSAVLTATLENINNEQKSYTLLTHLRDLDNEDDLNELSNRL